MQNKKIVATVVALPIALMLVGCGAGAGSEAGQEEAPTFTTQATDGESSQSADLTTEQDLSVSSPSETAESSSQGTGKNDEEVPTASGGAKIDGNRLIVSQLQPSSNAATDVTATFKGLKEFGFGKINVEFYKSNMNSQFIYPRDKKVAENGGDNYYSNIWMRITAFAPDGEEVTESRCGVDIRMDDQDGINRATKYEEPPFIREVAKLSDAAVTRCGFEVGIMNDTPGDYTLEIDYGLKGLPNVTIVQPVRIA